MPTESSGPEAPSRGVHGVSLDEAAQRSSANSAPVTARKGTSGSYCSSTACCVHTRTTLTSKSGMP
eukprot:3582718-Rhodomonas_salina.1